MWKAGSSSGSWHKSSPHRVKSLNLSNLYFKNFNVSDCPAPACRFVYREPNKTKQNVAVVLKTSLIRNDTLYSRHGAVVLMECYFDSAWQDEDNEAKQ